MSGRKLYTPRASISVSRDHEFSALSPALMANKRYSLSPTNLRENRNSNSLSQQYKPGLTSPTSVGDNSVDGGNGLRGSMKCSILDMTGFDERLAKMQFFQDDKYEIKMGNRNIEFDTQDEIFQITGPIDPNYEGENCINCDKEVSNSKKQHCQFCGSLACEKCMHKKRDFAPDEQDNIDQGLACKICDRKFFMWSHYAKFKEANEEQDNYLRDQQDLLSCQQNKYNIAKQEYYNRQKFNQKESERIKKKTREQQQRLTGFKHEIQQLQIDISDQETKLAEIQNGIKDIKRNKAELQKKNEHSEGKIIKLKTDLAAKALIIKKLDEKELAYHQRREASKSVLNPEKHVFKEVPNLHSEHTNVHFQSVLQPSDMQRAAEEQQMSPRQKEDSLEPSKWQQSNMMSMQSRQTMGVISGTFVDTEGCQNTFNGIDDSDPRASRKSIARKKRQNKKIDRIQRGQKDGGCCTPGPSGKGACVVF